MMRIELHDLYIKIMQFSHLHLHSLKFLLYRKICYFMASPLMGSKK